MPIKNPVADILFFNIPTLDNRSKQPIFFKPKTIKKHGIPEFYRTQFGYHYIMASKN
jgi:hypothetical protein